jgi:poly-gamma-glutamate capsule biosynthesis protein CapA/YwtB (metallophosphatase superfamily)
MSVDLTRPPGTARLFLAGDVMLGRGIDCILPHPGDPKLHESFVKTAETYVELAERQAGPIPRPVTFDHVWGDLIAELERRRPDLRLINLETAITISDTAEPKGINYRMHPANLAVLNAAEIDGCVLANNHMLDWGRDGLVETLDVLDAAAIAHAGAGRNLDEALAPMILPLAYGGRVIVLGFGAPDSGIPRHWAAAPLRPGVALLPDTTDAAVAAVKDAVAPLRQPGDRLIVSLHWGGNWGYDIPASQRDLACRLIDEVGVDLVHGHSSHHPKAAEVHDGRLILYGCGDLVNDYEGIAGHQAFRPELTLAWIADLDRSGALLGLEMLPFRLQGFRLTRTTDDEADWLQATMARECARLGGNVRSTAAGTLQFIPAGP